MFIYTVTLFIFLVWIKKSQDLARLLKEEQVCNLDEQEEEKKKLEFGRISKMDETCWRHKPDDSSLT